MPYIPTGRPPGRPRSIVLREDAERLTNVVPGRTLVVPRARLVTLAATGISVASLSRIYRVPHSTVRTFLAESGCDHLFIPTEPRFRRRRRWSPAG